MSEQDSAADHQDEGEVDTASPMTVDAFSVASSYPLPQPPSGQLLHQVRELVEHYMRPVPTVVVDPLTGATAATVLTKDGIKPVPASVFDEYLAEPRARRGTAKMMSLDSFIDHVNRFGSESTVVFANDDGAHPTLLAVIDYHAQGHASPAAFGRHRTTFEFPLSDEWKAWSVLNGKPMTLIQFAEFIEDRIVDVEHPDDVALTDEVTRNFVGKLGGTEKIASPTRLMELSQGLAINENANVKEAFKLSSGEGQVVFETDHTDANGLSVNIPTMFVLAIPVFRNGPFYRVLARLRYRLRPTLSFHYELWRTDRVFDHAFVEAVERVKDLANVPVLLGAPEA